MKYEDLKIEKQAMDILMKGKWIQRGKDLFSPKPYGECSEEEKFAIIYLVDNYSFNYGGRP